MNMIGSENRSNSYRGNAMVKWRDCHGSRQRLRYIHVIARESYPMFLFTFFYFACFAFLEHWNRLHYTVIHVALDDKIPFIEEFIIPYYAWFFYMVVAMVLFYLYDRDTYHRIAAMLCIGMSVFLVVSAVWPNIQYLRPTVMPRDNVFTRMIQGLYASDTPTNLCPSIHVYNSIAITIGVLKSSADLFHKKGVRIFCTVLGTSIILSTMFIKQHSVFDVLCAFLMASLVYILCYRYGFTFIESPVKAMAGPERDVFVTEDQI
jgi:membrane-associated phospholipid phosphatase